MLVSLVGCFVSQFQELMAYGVSNAVCSMLNCYVSSASLSRSLVQESAGGKTQVSTVRVNAPLFASLTSAIIT